MRRRRSWAEQLVSITDKGANAREAGLPANFCPYMGGYRNNNGPGGNLQRQRRKAWREGYDLADKRIREQEKEAGDK